MIKINRAEQLNFFSRVARWFFTRWKFGLLLFVLIIGSGILVYDSLIRREGFPPVDVPVSVVAGAYFVDNPQAVDQHVITPLSETVLQVDGVVGISSTANANSWQVTAELEDGLTNEEGNGRIARAIDEQQPLPEDASYEIPPLNAAKFNGEYDLLVALYSGNQDSNPTGMQKLAESLTGGIASLDEVEEAKVEPLVATGVNPVTKETETRQVAFSRIGLVKDGETTFYPSVTIGVVGAGGEELDIFELSDAVEEKLKKVNRDLDEGYGLTISADFTDGIDNQITSLENNVLTGVAAIILISALMIGWRVSAVTAVFMFAVMFTTIGLLFALGYTLNTITLFSLVLALGLFVDDATIIAEAIDAAKKPGARRKDIIKAALNGVGSASFAGTLTTVLVFIPLLFIGGVLGEFIFFLPFTVIIALLVSFTLSITLIPLLSRFSILAGKDVQAPASYARSNPVPDWLANSIRLLKTNRKTGVAAAAISVAISLGFILGSVYFAQKLSFNIFPAAKDADNILVRYQFQPGTTIEEAVALSKQVELEVSEIAGGNLVRAVYGRETTPDIRSADILLELTPFRERGIKAPAIAEALEKSLADNRLASVQVQQLDPGPPEEEFPFKMQIFGADTSNTLALARDVSTWLDGRSIERGNGTTAQITRTRIAGENSITRDGGQRYMEVLAAFDAEDVSALVQLTRDEVQTEFDGARLADYGVDSGDITFDFGQESENEESFSTLGPAAAVAIAAMFILLAWQFRSIIKPLLIFLALPFSLLGVAYGLYISNNDLSFFAMVGFIGLIGIAVNNTILLVDAANRYKRDGQDRIDAISSAVKRRFRPLFTTTATTIAALAPLAITDPFWEPLAVTIMFGLLSSTLLVIIAFPYYYIAADWLMAKIRSRFSKS